MAAERLKPRLNRVTTRDGFEIEVSRRQSDGKPAFYSSEVIIGPHTSILATGKTVAQTLGRIRESMSEHQSKKST